MPNNFELVKFFNEIIGGCHMAVNKKWVQVTEEDILAANINKYNDDEVLKYYTEKVDPKFTYIEYQVIFKAVMEVLSKKLGRSIKAVDMCGGAGKAAFIMKQCDPLSEISLVDLSEKMLKVARDRMINENVGDIRLIKTDAFSFLESDEQQYDLIVFSSAIHHFKDPIKLLITAAEKLSPQGCIVTIAEPTTIIKSTRFKIMTFIFGHKEYKQDVVKSWIKYIMTLGESWPAEDEFADIAEYQTYKGIDDRALSSQLSSAGLNPLVHLRYPSGDPIMLKVMPYMGLNWSFGMVLKKGRHPEDRRLSSELQSKIKEELPFKISFL